MTSIHNYLIVYKRKESLPTQPHLRSILLALMTQITGYMNCFYRRMSALCRQSAHRFASSSRANNWSSSSERMAFESQLLPFEVINSLLFVVKDFLCEDIIPNLFDSNLPFDRWFSTPIEWQLLVAFLEFISFPSLKNSF